LKTEANARHTTLRMAFQAQLPIEIETGPKKIIELTAETSLFGIRVLMKHTERGRGKSDTKDWSFLEIITHKTLTDLRKLLQGQTLKGLLTTYQQECKVNKKQ